ncbi:MAG: NADH-quinone oxidoreductase subunit J family protein [Candidatus Dormibacteria bacterium]
MTAILIGLMVLTVFGAIGVVFSPQTIYSALSLVVTVGFLAVIFLLLNAQFLFAVQLIIYAGAVMVLFVFIIALLDPSSEDRPRFLEPRTVIGVVAIAAITVSVFLAARNGITYNAGCVSATSYCMHGEVVGSGGGNANPYHVFGPTADEVNANGNVQTVGIQLFTTYLLPFEFTSLLLLVAAIGAVYLTRRSPSAERRTTIIPPGERAAEPGTATADLGDPASAGRAL